MGYNTISLDRINALKNRRTNNLAGGIAVGNASKTFDIKTASGMLRLTIDGNGNITKTANVSTLGSGVASKLDSASNAKSITCDNSSIVTGISFNSETYTLTITVGKLSVDNNKISIAKTNDYNIAIGQTSSVDVVTGMNYDSSTHKFNKVVSTVKLENGALSVSGDPQTSTVFTASPHSSEI